MTSTWGLDPSQTVITLIAVSENATFRITVDGVPVSVLRVHRPGHVGDAGQIAGELTWVRRLAEEAEVRVPDVVPTAAGNLLHTSTDAGGSEWHYVAFAFVAGEILEDFADPRPYYSEIGATTARLHQQVKRWPLPTGFTRFSWHLSDMLGDTSRWGDWRERRPDA